MTLRLTMTCGPYDRARALIDGLVQPRDIELVTTVNAIDQDRQNRFMAGEFDIAESYAGLYIAHRAAGTLPFTAVPIFVKRMFRHSYIYVNRHAGITRPEQLSGRRVGLQNWFTTMGIWARALLEEEFGVDLASITWVVEENKEADQRRPPGWDPPRWLRLETDPRGHDLTQLLSRGQIDAAMTTDVLAPDVDPNIDFLLPDYAIREREYFVRTGFFPIHHLLVVRDEILSEQPWVAMSLFDAWQASKAECYRWLEWQRIHHTAMWYRALWEEERAAAGSDPYAWGFSKAQAELTALLGYAHRYGLTARLLSPRELFHPSTLQT